MKYKIARWLDIAFAVGLLIGTWLIIIWIVLEIVG